MLGWHIVVFKTDATYLDHEKSTNELRIASWSTGIRGRDWLNKLADENKIKYLGGNGYPFRYSAIAYEILPIITTGITTLNESIMCGNDYVLQFDELRSLELNSSKISNTGPYDHLLIEVWDQS